MSKRMTRSAVKQYPHQVKQYFVDTLSAVEKTKRLTNQTKKLKNRLTENEKHTARIQVENDRMKTENEKLQAELAELKKSLARGTKRSRSKPSTRSKSKSKSASASSVPPLDVAKYNKYLRMIKVGMPWPNVERAMAMDKVTPPKNIDLSKITKQQAQTWIGKEHNASTSNQFKGITLKKSRKSPPKKETPPVTAREVREAYQPLAEELSKYEQKEVIQNYIGVDNETRKNEKKMENIRLVKSLMDSGKIQPTSTRLKILNTINETAKTGIGKK